MNATLPKERRTFRYHDACARQVELAGDFTRWLKAPIPMRPLPGGDWEVTIPLAPGTYHYRFLVDNEWRDDPHCGRRVRNPFGTVNDIVQVGLHRQ